MLTFFSKLNLFGEEDRKGPTYFGPPLQLLYIKYLCKDGIIFPTKKIGRIINKIFKNI